MAVNDLIIAGFAVGDVGDDALALTTAGYTEETELFSDGSSWDANGSVFYKYHNGSDTTCVSTAVGGTDASNCLIVMVFRGVALAVDGGPWSATPVTATGINVLDPDPPSIDYDTPGSAVVIFGGAASGADGNGTYTFPTGYVTNAISEGQIDTEDMTCGMGYNLAPSDPENPGAMSHSGSTTTGTSWFAYTLALQPAVTLGEVIHVVMSMA
jgi:hypothetical protein